MTQRLRIRPLVIACAAAAALAGGICAEAVAHGGASRSAESTPPWLGAVPGLGAVAPDPPPDGAPVELDGCTIANPLLKRDPAEVRAFVPEEYELGENSYFGPGFATIIVAYMFCDKARVQGRRPAPAVISLIAAQVVADPIGDDPVDALYDVYNRSTLNFLPTSSWYLLAAQTNHKALATRLRGAELPVEHAPDLVYRSDYGGPQRKDSVAVPSRDGDYGVATTTMFSDVFTHNHDWFFWHDPAPKGNSRTAGSGRTGFFLHLHAMDDSSCGYHLSDVVRQVRPECGAKLTAERGSEIASFLGGSSLETPYAFNHPPSHARGYIDLPPR